jgi:rubrerythrin
LEVIAVEQVNFQQALNYAISKEKEAAALYIRMANISTDPQAKSFLLDMSKEEERHEHMLNELATRGAIEDIEFSHPPDMKIVEYLKPSKSAPEMTYQEALLFAAQREKEAAEYYTHMAGIVADATAEELFKSLASWELGHKAKVEAEYERYFMPEN